MVSFLKAKDHGQQDRVKVERSPAPLYSFHFNHCGWAFKDVLSRWKLHRAGTVTDAGHVSE